MGFVEAVRAHTPTKNKWENKNLAHVQCRWRDNVSLDQTRCHKLWTFHFGVFDFNAVRVAWMKWKLDIVLTIIYPKSLPTTTHQQSNKTLQNKKWCARMIWNKKSNSQKSYCQRNEHHRENQRLEEVLSVWQRITTNLSVHTKTR